MALAMSTAHSIHFFILFSFICNQINVCSATGDCKPITQSSLDNPCSQNSILVVNDGDEDLICGAEVAIAHVSGKGAPKIVYKDAEKGQFYTVFMLDPDAPNHSQGKYWLHWTVINVKGEDLGAGSTSSGTTITNYKAPGPPAGTGVHRYQFYVVKQKKSTVSARDPSSRGQFAAAEYANGLDLCGPPAASFEFKTQNAANKNRRST